MTIDQNTKLYCSFAKTAGSFGCRMHNFGFRVLGINAIYKSFSVTDIQAAIHAMKTLGISGAGITMPFKNACLNYVDECHRDAWEIGAVNTIVWLGPKLVAHNTDVTAASTVIAEQPHTTVVVLGNGGYAKAVIHAARRNHRNVRQIVRRNWEDVLTLRDSLVYNCTPVQGLQLDPSNVYVDCDVNTPSGQRLALLQGAEQFRLYTGREFPIDAFRESGR